MSKWESLHLFILTHEDMEEKEFLEIYPFPILIQQKQQGIAIKDLLKVKQAAKGIINLEEIDCSMFPGFSKEKKNQDVYKFLPISEEQPYIYLGQKPSRGITLAFPWLEEEHVRIEKQNFGFYTIQDLSSKEGTYLNGKSLMSGVDYPLGDCCTIMFGKAIKYLYFTPEGLFNYIQACPLDSQSINKKRVF